MISHRLRAPKILLSIEMDNLDVKRNLTVRIIVGVCIMLILAAIHFFRPGSYLSGKLYIYYYSYASDIMLPFGSYFLLGMNEIQLRFLRKWYIKVIIVISVMSFSEILQLFGVYLFGNTEYLNYVSSAGPCPPLQYVPLRSEYRIHP